MQSKLTIENKLSFCYMINWSFLLISSILGVGQLTNLDWTQFFLGSLPFMIFIVLHVIFHTYSKKARFKPNDLTVAKLTWVWSVVYIVVTLTGGSHLYIIKDITDTSFLVIVSVCTVQTVISYSLYRCMKLLCHIQTGVFSWPLSKEEQYQFIGQSIINLGLAPLFGLGLSLGVSYINNDIVLFSLSRAIESIIGKNMSLVIAVILGFIGIIIGGRVMSQAQHRSQAQPNR